MNVLSKDYRNIIKENPFPRKESKSLTVMPTVSSLMFWLYPFFLGMFIENGAQDKRVANFIVRETSPDRSFRVNLFYVLA